ncbi:MAG: sugar ABC transporter permease [Spirochaetia bacterium]|nr:sugar ABC transporter permease [Spirochaetia bacterium]
MIEKKNEHIRAGFMFASPGLFFFAMVVLVPFFYGFYLTLTDWNGVNAQKIFVGLSNYKTTISDPAFWNSMLLTLKYVIWVVILVNVLGFILGYLLTNGLKGQNFFRSGFFTPNLIGGIVLGFIWEFLFSRVFVAIGKSSGFESLSSSWLSSPNTAFWALVIVTVWQLVGYMMLIYISGFTSMSKDVLEAASIDGATGLRRVKDIIFPLMMPSVVICTFLTLSRAFMVYDINLTLTKGGPFMSTVLVAMHVYNKAFTERLYGVGQAEALFLFLVVAIISVIQVRAGRSKEVEA